MMNLNLEYENTCPIIRKDGTICGNKLISGNRRKEKDKDGNKTGRLICKTCYDRNYWHISSYRENRKLLAGCRTGNLIYWNHIIGDLFEDLTSIWKKVKVLSKINGRNGPLDHSVDSNGITYQTKGKIYDDITKQWFLGQLIREWNKIFDYEICYCASKDGKDIERIYEFPKRIIKDIRTGISIYNNDNDHWYDQYRITDKETIMLVNKIWKEITNEYISKAICCDIV
jgi:hypothetical protein